jgi:hypothetical protein
MNYAIQMIGTQRHVLSLELFNSVQSFIYLNIFECSISPFLLCIRFIEKLNAFLSILEDTESVDDPYTYVTNCLCVEWVRAEIQRLLENH